MFGRGRIGIGDLLKSKVFMSKSIEQLKRNIQQESEAIPQDMLERVMADFIRRLEECVANGAVI